MAQKKSYIFTNKNHPKQGIMSILLGLIADASIVMALYLTFVRRSEALVAYGLVVILATIMALIGFGLAVYVKTRSDIFYLTAYLGFLFNGIGLLVAGIIIYAGVYGI